LVSKNVHTHFVAVLIVLYAFLTTQTHHKPTKNPTMKILKSLTLLFTLCCLLLLAACNKTDKVVTPPVTTGNTDVDALVALNVPESFNYNTDQEVTLNITILAPDNSPVKNIPVRILNKIDEAGGLVLFKSLTDASGNISGIIKLPAYTDKIVVDPKYLGIMRNATVNIVNKTISCTLGGSNGYSGNVVPDVLLGGRPFPQGRPLSPLAIPYSYMGTYTSDGKPNYLESTNDVIDAAFLDKVNTSLPEGVPVMTSHPDYILNDIETNLNVTALSDVWLTFLTEGAGYKNSIAYFKYNTSTPPTKASDIDSLHIILPNASLQGSGGSLRAGNKVNLGRFAAGTSIGFALIANGWTGSAVGSGYHTVYSIDGLNPETLTAEKRHSVLLWDNSLSLFLVGFEDLKRTNGAGDNDFNDCLFYIKSNPVEAVSRARVNPIDIPVDRDGDGVNDVYDDFPNDPLRAYINYYPSQTTFGTLAFEDKWPFLGDYDMNDLVVDYRYTVVSNALNKAIEMQAKYVLKASGAAFRNGFGVEFPFASALVQSATGTKVTNTSVVSLGANGCETGQTKAVIIPFDDALTVFNRSGGYVNTKLANPVVTPDTTNMNITFTRGLSTTEMGTIPFNPFIIINKTRGREAHLPGFTATQKIDVNYYKTGEDNTIPAQNKYFKTTTNLPWAISFLEQFDYPIEGKVMQTAFTAFIPWVTSGGTASTNWYKDSVNRVSSNIYHR
jgi:LruC domain-containing protein